MRFQPTPKGSTASTDDEICDQMLDIRHYYVKRLGYENRDPPCSRSSKANIYAAYDAWLVEIQRQVAEDRLQADELAAHVHSYQSFQK